MALPCMEGRKGTAGTSRVVGGGLHRCGTLPVTQREEGGRGPLRRSQGGIRFYAVGWRGKKYTSLCYEKEAGGKDSVFDWGRKIIVADFECEVGRKLCNRSRKPKFGVGGCGGGFWGFGGVGLLGWWHERKLTLGYFRGCSSGRERIRNWVTGGG